MRCTLRTLLFIIIWGITSCNHYNATLLEAESIMEDNPEQALTLLTGIENPDQSLSRKDFALYNLLYTQATHKCDKDLMECTGINHAINYFRLSKDSPRAAKAFFYGGLVSESINNLPQAVEYYLKARDLLKGSDDYKYQFMVRYYLGDLYFEQWLTDDYLGIFREAVSYAELLNTPYYLTLSYHNIGVAYAEINKNDSALYYQKKALESAKTGFIDLLPNIYYHLWLINTADTQQMVAFKDSLCAVLPDDALTYSVIGETFTALNQTDSALKYLRKSLISDNLLITTDSHFLISEAFESCGKYDSATHYLKQYVILKDSVEEQLLSSEVLKSKNFYYHNRFNDENLILKANELANTLMITILTITVLSAIIFIILSYIWFDNKKSIFKQENDKLFDTNELERLEYESKILLIREKFYEFVNIQTVPQFTSKKIRLTDEDWEKVYENADNLFDNFTNRLKEQYPLITTNDIRICCLLKMNINNTTMSHILYVEPASIRKQKLRIAVEKIGLKDGKSLDEFIRKF